MNFIELLKVIILGIIEGITEWLPISSTGHMILADEFIKLNVSNEFLEMFLVVIQLGAILAVLVIYFKKLIPLEIKNKKLELKKDTLNLWYKIIIACIPAAVIGLLFEDIIDELFYNSFVVALALIIYGVLFILIENKGLKVKVKNLDDLDCKTAFKIGLFQVLSLIPGTSRSGSTILGGMLCGADRTVGAEFTFYLAIPIMLGASLLKLLKFGFAFTSSELLILLIGMLTAFLMSIVAIKFLVAYIKKNDFKAFGYYRIVLGIIVLIYFAFK